MRLHHVHSGSPASLCNNPSSWSSKDELRGWERGEVRKPGEVWGGSSLGRGAGPLTQQRASLQASFSPEVPRRAAAVPGCHRGQDGPRPISGSPHSQDEEPKSNRDTGKSNMQLVSGGDRRSRLASCFSGGSRRPVWGGGIQAGTRV